MGDNKKKDVSLIEALPNNDNSKLEDLNDGGKRKKNRRRKNKRKNIVAPYSVPNHQAKLTWQQRKMQDQMRAVHGFRVKNRRGIILNKQPLAPYNTNQFLLEDHGYLQEIDEHLNSGKLPPPARTRDSSFSVDSEVDAFYSSPDDEEEFLTREFSNTYQDMRAERLNSMTREQLVQECLELENRLERVTKCLKTNENNESTVKSDETDDVKRDDVVVIEQKPAKLSVVKILRDLDRLRRENEMLRLRLNHNMKLDSTTSSIDSESDSSSSCSSSKSSTSSSSSLTSSNNAKDEQKTTTTDSSLMNNGTSVSPKSTDHHSLSSSDCFLSGESPKTIDNVDATNLPVVATPES